MMNLMGSRLQAPVPPPSVSIVPSRCLEPGAWSLEPIRFITARRLHAHSDSVLVTHGLQISDSEGVGVCESVCVCMNVCECVSVCI